MGLTHPTVAVLLAAPPTWLKWPLPPNPATTPASYVFEAWALDTSRNETLAATSHTMVVRGKPSARPTLKS